MKSSKYRKVKVNITTYKEDIVQERNMNKDKKMNQTNPNKLICSICLNSKQEEANDNKKNHKSCPICQLSCDICIEKAINHTDKVNNRTHNINKVNNDHKQTQTKSVQTNIDLNKSMNLLNEVLTVFQSRKIEQVKPKTVILKDASVSTNGVKTSAKLSVSKVFQMSLDNRTNEDGKFLVISSKEDKRSNLDLSKSKSSSIPQMKIEQLKYSLKEKTKSKDAVEEVNRMFATVKKNYNNDDLNRPSIRSGPRILPVVVETTLDSNGFVKANETKITQNYTCKCCQTHIMSSGDSIKCCHNGSKTQCHREIEGSDKAQCCHNENRCEKCVYMLCCHYKKSRKMHAGVMICERCRDGRSTSFLHSEHSFEGSG